MIALTIFRTILYSILKLVLYFVQLILGLFVCFFSFGCGLFEKIGEFLGSIFVLGSILCLIMGIVEWKEFWSMFFVGVAFGAIPAFIKMLGEDTLCAIIKVLGEI